MSSLSSLPLIDRRRALPAPQTLHLSLVTSQWLLHASFGLGSHLRFVIFKFLVQQQLQLEQ
jgi:hypothetical protein